MTAVYTLLLGLTLLLVIGAIAVLAMNDASHSDDLQLRLRIQSLVRQVEQTPAASPAARQSGSDEAPGAGEASDPNRRLEEEGVLTFVLPVHGGAVQPVVGAGGELPVLREAAAALGSPSGRFATVNALGGQVRLFSQPVTADGVSVAVVQGARSRAFVENTIRRLVLVTLGAGLAGLALSALAGFWLAGLTLRPISETLRRQRAFTADASHELRTPIAILRGNAETLARHEERTIREYRELVGDMIEESGRLTRLIGEMLTLARVDEGRAAISEARVDFSATVAEAARRFEGLVHERSLSLTTDIAAAVTVRGDPERLSQLTAILLDNAVRYTVRGEITVRLLKHGHTAELSVQDTGPGIAAEHLPRLFDRFYRADAARASDTGGTGLGLAIAQQTAALHRGRITVESTLGAGTTFRFRLPAAS